MTLSRNSYPTPRTLTSLVICPRARLRLHSHIHSITPSPHLHPPNYSPSLSSTTSPTYHRTLSPLHSSTDTFSTGPTLHLSPQLLPILTRLSSLSRKKTHPTNNSPSFFGTLPPNQTPQHRLPLQHQLLASPGAAPTHRFVAFARSVISRFPLTLGRTLLFLASTVEPSFPLASHSNVERHILGASR